MPTNKDAHRLALSAMRDLTVARDAATIDQIKKELKLRRKALKRTCLDARHIKNALQHLGHLPGPGESLHFIVDGTFTPCSLIPTIRQMSHPAIINQLTVTTLGLNRDNATTIAAGLFQGKVKKCDILVSTYFRNLDGSDFEYVKQTIEEQGGRVYAMRTHCKMILLEMSDGNWYTIEGSGNLRACSMIEQFCMTNDRDLLLFHRNWLSEYMTSRADGRT